MKLDILVGVFSALAQFVTAWLGWQVTIRPLGAGDERRKTIYKSLFLAAGVLGIAADARALFSVGVLQIT